MDVFTYNDYRKLLKDYYNREKERLPNKFSYRYFSKKCGFLSPNFIHYVITGRRNLSYKSIQKIGRAMELAPRVIQFLETLVHYNQTKDPEEKAEAFEKMISFQEFRDAQKLSQEQYDFYSKWYYPIIRELVNLKNFSEDPSWICKRLYSEISPVEAQQAIENLEKLGLLASSLSPYWNHR
jgi:uncharacterized protein (TIGR02147 family)